MLLPQVAKIPAPGQERGCVVLDQPQHAASSRRLRTSHPLRLVFDTAALRSNGAGKGSRVSGHVSSTGCENSCTGSGARLCRPRPAAARGKLPTPSNFPPAAAGLRHSRAPFQWRGEGIKGEWPCFFHRLRKFLHRVRSAAVSSSTNRSTRQAPDAFELPTRCGWSSTQPRSVPNGAGKGSRVRVHASSTGCENSCTGSGARLCRPRPAAARGKLPTPSNFPPAAAGLRHSRAPFQWRGEGIKGEWPCFFHRLRKFLHRVRSAAVSSSTSRSTRQAPDAFELPTRCGWSSTQPRSVPMARGEGSERGGVMLVPHVAKIFAPGQDACLTVRAWICSAALPTRFTG